MATDQGTLNTAVWRDADRVRDYTRLGVRPVEATIIERYGDALTGRTLDVGCGAGRLTRPLGDRASRIEAFDVSPRMVAAAKAASPAADVREGDLRDLSPYPTGAYDAIWVGFNTIDILDHESRGAFLDALCERLTPDGLLVFSSHNRASEAAQRGPRDIGHRSLLGRLRVLPRLPRRTRNHRRNAPLERREAEYAVLTDEENDFAGLHYYIDRDSQERQLAAHGLELVECLDRQGGLVAPGTRAELTPELHYVARRATTV